jgi:hypothetical protein
MNFIRKIAEKKVDDWTHNQFIRYGRGNYAFKAMLNVTKSSKHTKVKTGFEFAGEFAYKLADSIEGTTRVTGGMITKLKAEELGLGFEIAETKQFAGVKTHKIDCDLTKDQVKGIFDKYPTTLILLSFKTDKGELKSLVKSPRPPKGPKKEDPKPKFCTLKITDEKWVKDLLFDVKREGKKISIKHTFNIDEVEVPKEFLKDHVMARMKAIRKGKLIREITIGEDTVVNEYDLIV